MNRKILAEGKRLREWYICDPDFRKQFEEDPEAAVRSTGISMDTDSAKKIICSDDPDTVKEHPFFVNYREWLEYVHAETAGKTSRENIRHDGLAAYMERVTNRQRLENRNFRLQSAIRYFPVIAELTEGCSVQCPFCGLDSEPLQKIFTHTEENATLFKESIQTCLEILGPVAGAGCLYSATEPLDNPDYEQFLKDFRELTGFTAQTTTALADQEPERVRKMMRDAGEQELKKAAFRFSIRSLVQFKKIMSSFTPEELTFVELVPNNPESVYAYSLTGRAGAMTGEAVSKKNFIAYSISCCAGFRINFARKRIYCEEPVMPCAVYPTGVRVRGFRDFRDSLSFRKSLLRLLDDQMSPGLFQKKLFRLNPNVRVTYEADRITLTGDQAGAHLQGQDSLVKSIHVLEKNKVKLSDLPYRDQKAWQTLYQKGYLVDV